MNQISCLLVIVMLGFANSQVTYLSEWQGNRHSRAGARGVSEFTGLGDGTCYVTFPGPVYWFYCENCDVVPAKSKSEEGIYALATPNNDWQDTGNFYFVVNFLEEAYQAENITWICDPEDTNKITVYSFPSSTNQLSKVRSRIYVQEMNEDHFVNIQFPTKVNNFMVDSPNTFVGGLQSFQIQNIQSWQKEISFEFQYVQPTWFTAFDISISESDKALAKEEKRKRRNAHY